VRRAITLRPTAKINLTLRVGPALPTGFHEIRTLMQSVGISDTLTCSARSGRFTLQARGAGLAADESNLVYRAAAALWTAAGRTGPPRDVHVKLEKTIPIAAGLGGGSADAAATLVGLNQVWDLGLPLHELVRIGAGLGSDIPFFFHGGTAIGVGRGEEIYPVDDIKRFAAVIVKPALGVSTSDAYRWCDEDRAAGLPPTFGNPAELNVGWPAGPLVLVNELQGPVARRHPVIAEIIAACMREGAIASAMTGSGSAVFGLFRETVATRAAQRLRRPDWLVLLTRTMSRSEARRRICL
jgi:4-diphosphocytidyl-2-C-methyl-D-erythritol kinase